MPTKTSHIMFDLDGLLIDTETLFTQINNKLCEAHGKQFTWEIKAQQMGHKPEEASKIIIAALQLPLTVSEVLEFSRAQEEILFPTAALMPGVERLLKHLKNSGIQMCVASGSDSHSFALKTTLYKDLWSHYFTHTVASGDDPEVLCGKPDPLVFQIALSRFQSPPPLNDVLIFEDAPNGVEAGLKAGMHVVWVPDTRADRSHYQGNPNVTIINSLLDFQPELFGLPPFPS